MQEGQSGWKFIYDADYFPLFAIFLFPPPRALKKFFTALRKSESTKWRQMCADLLSRFLLCQFFFPAFFRGALCQLGLGPVRASPRRGPAESLPTTPNALKEANCCMRSPRFLGSSALCTEEEWGRIWIIHSIPGHRWKIHFSLYNFSFCSFISEIIAYPFWFTSILFILRFATFEISRSRPKQQRNGTSQQLIHAEAGKDIFSSCSLPV